MFLLSAAFAMAMQTAAPRVDLHVRPGDCAVEADGAPMPYTEFAQKAAQWRQERREIFLSFSGDSQCDSEFTEAARKAGFSRVFLAKGVWGDPDPLRIYIGPGRDCPLEVDGQPISQTDFEALIRKSVRAGRSYDLSPDFNADGICGATVRQFLVEAQVEGMRP